MEVPRPAIRCSAIPVEIWAVGEHVAAFFVLKYTDFRLFNQFSKTPKDFLKGSWGHPMKILAMGSRFVAIFRFFTLCPQNQKLYVGVLFRALNCRSRFPIRGKLSEQISGDFEKKQNTIRSKND